MSYIAVLFCVSHFVERILGLFTELLQSLDCLYDVSQKPPPFYTLNNSAKNEPILIIFGLQNSEEILYRKIINSH